MTYNEIYKISSSKKISWKEKINYNKIIMSTQNNWIIIIGSAKQCKAQILND
jgi:hypothetical protein